MEAYWYYTKGETDSKMLHRNVALLMEKTGELNEYRCRFTFLARNPQDAIKRCAGLKHELNVKP